MGKPVFDNTPLESPPGNLEEPEKRKIVYKPNPEVAVARQVSIPRSVYDNQELLHEYLLTDPDYLSGEKEYFEFLKNNPGTDKIYEVTYKVVG